MKKVNSINVAVTYAGCVVGAGFLSGQELWQFFGSYGKLGFLGFVLAIIFQLALGYIVLAYAYKSQTSEFDVLIVRKNVKPLRLFFSISEIVFIFSVVVIMFAGSGSLIKTAFGINDVVGSIIFATLITLVAFLGISGIVSVLSYTIPILTIMTLIVSILALSKYGFPNLNDLEVTGKTTLMPNFIIAFILFSVHNLFCTLGVLAPMGYSLENKKTALNGMILSSVILIIISISVLLPISAKVGFSKSELPMLDLAKTIGGPLFYIYAILLLIGMFGSALSHFVSLIDFSFRKSNFLRKNKGVYLISMAIISFLLSRIGFSKIISIAYPISGYVGIVALIMITCNYFIKPKV